MPEKGTLRILACLALSPRMQAVIGEAMQLSKALNSELEFVHVGEVTPSVQDAIALVKAKLAPGMAEPVLIVENGRPHEVIGEVIHRRRADLVLIGAIEKEKLFTGVFGSVARRVARNAECPVLILTNPRVEGTQYRTIVISMQYDAESAGLIQFVLRMVRAWGTHAVHVVHEGHSVARLMSQFEDAPLQELAERHRVRLTTERARIMDFLAPFDFEGVSLTCEYLEETEGLSAVEYTRNHGGDLLVYPVPARPLTFWDRFFNHPVENILEKLPTAVLLYRTRPEPDGPVERPV